MLPYNKYMIKVPEYKYCLMKILNYYLISLTYQTWKPYEAAIRGQSDHEVPKEHCKVWRDYQNFLKNVAVKLTVNCDVNATCFSHPGFSRNEVGDLAVELSIFVVLLHLLLQLTRDWVQITRLTGGREIHVHLWRTQRYLQDEGIAQLTLYSFVRSQLHFTLLEMIEKT